MSSNLNKFINFKNLVSQVKNFNNNSPFDHVVVDNFFKNEIAQKLETEFPAFDDKVWHEYKNAIEIKKTCNNWNFFPSLTYKIFSFLSSKDFINFLSESINSSEKIYPDQGLNGGGWHIHGRGGKLNPHLDYSIHPKLNLQRKFNLIIYLNSQWKREWGGNLGLWENSSSEKPGKMIKSIEPLFNRAIIFDTTQNSWHGLMNKLICPKSEYRKSIAIYYLCEPSKTAPSRGKALFYPTEDQKNDTEILELIKKRSDIKTASRVYK